MKETDLKFRFTLGSAILWISFLLPFVFLTLHVGATGVYYGFSATGILLLLGFIVYCWEDFRAKRPFSWGMLIYFFMMAFLYTVISPLLMASSGAEIRIEELKAHSPN